MSAYGLTLFQPDFDSELAELIVKLETVRSREFFVGNTPERWYSGLKEVFFMLESVCSARIEGNRTTVAEYIASAQSGAPTQENIQEISNLVGALRFIEDTIDGVPISQAYIRELHKYAVNRLSSAREGDRTPGEYRRGEVRILNSEHEPPESGDVPALMAELVDWLNEPRRRNFDLIKIAQAHWRFVWIHPFSNGNGRTARLLTYALLCKYGFVPTGMIVNPNGMFCSQRDAYYRALSDADSGSPDAIERWCLFFLRGLKQEVESAARLLERRYVEQEIVLPTLEACKESENISELEHKILLHAVAKDFVQLKDVSEGRSDRATARALAELKKKKLLVPIEKNARTYEFSIAPILYRFLVERFTELGLTRTLLNERPKF